MLRHRRYPLSLRRSLGHAETLEDRLALSAAPAVSAVSFAGSDWTTDFTDHLLASGAGQNHSLAGGHEVLSAGYLAPTGSSAQERSLPWDNLDQIRITFTEDVHVDAADLALSSVGQPFHEFADFQYYPEVQTAVWTLATPLATERYQIDLDADGADPVTNLGGTVLDGEWTNSVSAGISGDGAAGGDFEFAFNVLPGDTLNLGVTEFNNFFTIFNRSGLDTTSPLYLAEADVDGSGFIDQNDWQPIFDILSQGMANALPIGTPLGAANDAPTTTGFAPQEIDSAAGDVVFSLYDAFEDAETPDAQLTYAIESVGDPALFDAVTLDATTGELTVNTSAGVGQTEIVVSATDASGQKVLAPIDLRVNETNIRPSLTISVTDAGLGIWIIDGQVNDPDVVGNFDPYFVEITGSIDQRVSVAEDGSFFYSLLLDPGELLFLFADVSDDIDISIPIFFEVG